MIILDIGRSIVEFVDFGNRVLVCFMVFVYFDKLSTNGS